MRDVCQINTQTHNGLCPLVTPHFDETSRLPEVRLSAARDYWRDLKVTVVCRLIAVRAPMAPASASCFGIRIYLDVCNTTRSL